MLSFMMILLAVVGRMSLRNDGRQDFNSSNSDMEYWCLMRE